MAVATPPPRGRHCFRELQEGEAKMSDSIEDPAIPFPASQTADVDKLTIYGVWLNENWNRPTPLEHQVLAYGFCYQGHCYRLSIPAEYRFKYTQEKSNCVAVCDKSNCSESPRYDSVPDGTPAGFIVITSEVPKVPEPAIGCGFTGVFVQRGFDQKGDSTEEIRRGYLMWNIDRTTKIVRVERRQGTAEELILDFNLPGRPPSTLTYSAKVGIASRAGKIHD
jgi:hypothetical protein